MKLPVKFPANFERVVCEAACVAPINFNYIQLCSLNSNDKVSLRMKLEERERDNKTQIMRVKDVVRAPLAPTSAYPGSQPLLSI